jgi:hypothetical protein
MSSITVSRLRHTIAVAVAVAVAVAALALSTAAMAPVAYAGIPIIEHPTPRAPKAFCSASWRCSSSGSSGAKRDSCCRQSVNPAVLVAAAA